MSFDVSSFVNLKRRPQFGFDQIQQYYLIHQGDKHHRNTAEVNNNRETYSSAKHATEQTDARPEMQWSHGCYGAGQDGPVCELGDD